ncbi:MAG TPA: transporter, partial [Candidatus Limnocylindria bacterium]|nr:transporter [Candidatus Limnocylindria bacterium]
KWFAGALLAGALVWSIGGTVAAAEKRPIDVIEGDSFLIEEAYNQEPGVVQHIFTAAYTKSGRTQGWAFNFTREWPVFSQDHQLSYTIPSFHMRDDGSRVSGLGDILLNYRYQLVDEADAKPAVAPRFSLILPTGNRKKGTGNNVVGYQLSLPVSKKISNTVALHGNAGATFLPHVKAPVDINGNSAKKSLTAANIGGSAIYALLPRFHLMLEWVGNFDQSFSDAGKRERAFLATMSPGFRTAIVDQDKLQIVTGAAVPIGLNRKTDNLGAFLYLSIEHDLF